MTRGFPCRITNVLEPTLRETDLRMQPDGLLKGTALWPQIIASKKLSKKIKDIVPQ